MSAELLPRSYLYVPGNVSAKLAKATTRGSDALILDLEDAVPLAEKDSALETVVAWVSAQPAPGAVELWVRVNPGARRLTDVRALAGLSALRGLILAKVEDAHEVVEIGELLRELGDTSTLLMPMIETPGAVLDAREIARQPRVHQLQVGEIDLAGEAGITPGPDEAELGGIRTMIVLASAAAGINPPVGPVSRITNDVAALAESTARVARQGFMGRACIHPAQVPVVHGVFTPDAAEVEEALSVIDLVEDAELRGTGVVLDPQGRLVDVAVLHAARRVLALHHRSVDEVASA